MKYKVNNNKKRLPKGNLSLTGFTLVEIMVVVAIIGLLATVSISMMLRNQLNTNETIAITSCRTIVSACHSYYASNIPHAYPPDLTQLGTGGGSGPAYISDNLAAGAKSGYTFIYAKTADTSFTLYGEPTTIGRTGNRFFYADETGKLTAKEGARAGPNDPTVQ